MSRGILTAGQKSAKGIVGPVVGKDTEALRKPERPTTSSASRQVPFIAPSSARGTMWFPWHTPSHPGQRCDPRRLQFGFQRGLHEPPCVIEILPWLRRARTEHANRGW